MSTCNWLDLQTLGYQPVIMPKNLPDRWCNVSPGGDLVKFKEFMMIYTFEHNVDCIECFKPRTIAKITTAK